MSNIFFFVTLIAGIFIFILGFYKLYKESDWTLLILGFLILVSWFSNYVKRHNKDKRGFKDKES